MAIKLGDIFEVKLTDNKKQYFQFIGNDTSMLNSSVIRAFKGKHPRGTSFEAKQVIGDEIQFHAHVFIRSGIKMALWSKVGNAAVADTDALLFRNSDDYGNPQIKISNNWYIWKINEPFVYVGELKEKYRNAEIGVVVTPSDIVIRMQIERYDFVYPEY